MSLRVLQQWEKSIFHKLSTLAISQNILTNCSSFFSPLLSFLNLTLPSSNIELRNKCLDRSGPLTIRNMHDDTISSVEKLITAVFRKEVDFYRKIEVNITSETNLQSLNLD